MDEDQQYYQDLTANLAYSEVEPSDNGETAEDRTEKILDKIGHITDKKHHDLFLPQWSFLAENKVS